jgi:hypothetical protein
MSLSKLTLDASISHQPLHFAEPNFVEPPVRVVKIVLIIFWRSYGTTAEDEIRSQVGLPSVFQTMLAARLLKSHSKNLAR